MKESWLAPVCSLNSVMKLGFAVLQLLMAINHWPGISDVNSVMGGTGTGGDDGGADRRCLLRTTCFYTLSTHTLNGEALLYDRTQEGNGSHYTGVSF